MILSMLNLSLSGRFGGEKLINWWILHSFLKGCAKKEEKKPKMFDLMPSKVCRQLPDSAIRIDTTN
jgi:hypothetical protein